MLWLEYIKIKYIVYGGKSEKMNMSWIIDDIIKLLRLISLRVNNDILIM